MTDIRYEWLKVSEIADYARLCAEVKSDLDAAGLERFMDFLTVPQCFEAITEQRILGMRVDEELAATIIVEHCHLGDRIQTRFSGVELDELNRFGVYLRNGMVGPRHQGKGFYNLLMKHVVDLHAEEPIAGTMNVLNVGPQRACIAAGLMPTSKLTRIKDGTDTMLYSYIPEALSVEKVA